MRLEGTCPGRGGGEHSHLLGPGRGGARVGGVGKQEGLVAADLEADPGLRHEALDRDLSHGRDSDVPATDLVPVAAKADTGNHLVRIVGAAGG